MAPRQLQLRRPSRRTSMRRLLVSEQEVSHIDSSIYPELVAAPQLIQPSE
jgi:hypothetical protein